MWRVDDPHWRLLDVPSVRRMATVSTQTTLAALIVVVFVAMAINYAQVGDWKNAAATLLLAAVNGILFW